MAAQEPGQQPSLTALPRLEDLPKSGDGYDPDKVREAFEAFRRHSAQLQAQLRVLQAASRSGQSVEPTGHAVRMDALHLIRTASEFATRSRRMHRKPPRRSCPRPRKRCDVADASSRIAKPRSSVTAKRASANARRC